MESAGEVRDRLLDALQSGDSSWKFSASRKFLRSKPGKLRCQPRFVHRKPLAAVPPLGLDQALFDRTFADRQAQGESNEIGIVELDASAGILVIVHYAWVQKSDIREPIIWGSIAMLLLILRIPAVRRKVVRYRKKISTSFGRTAASTATKTNG